MFRSIFFSFIGLIIVAACSDEAIEVQNPQADCSTHATIKDLTGLDGCGFVFELEDGTRLLPIVVFYCGTPPLPKDLPPNPLAGYEYLNGKKVMIDYTLSEGYAGTCMAGKYASITCISDVPQLQSNL
jgi:hypothetical protein